MYNPYGYPTGYGPQAPQFGAFGQGMMQPGSFQNAPQMAPQAAQQQTQASGMPVVLQVANIKQVEQAPVQPGGKALVLVANEPVIAMRTADNMGITSTDYYHIAKFDPDATAAAPAGDYVTRSEFQQALSQLAQKMQQSAPQAVSTASAEKEAKAK